MNKQLKALVIDDEDALRKLYIMRFEQEGFKTLWANNGNDGLRLAEEEKPDVIILDIIMPGLHGYEVMQKIRGNSDLDKTVVIITSAKSYKADIEAAKKLGADDYCIKPMDFDDLLEVVNKHLNKRSGLSP